MKKIILAAAALALAMAAPAVMPDDMVADMPFAVVAKAAVEETAIDGTELKWSLTDEGVLTISGTGAMADYEYGAQPWYEYMGDITSVVIESGVTSIGMSAFEGCSELREVKIHEGVTEIGMYAFYSCKGITEITIPESVTEIGSYAFYNCTGITEISIPKGVTTIDDVAFGYCSSLAEINVDEDNANYSALDGVLFNKDKTTLVQYPAGNSDTHYTIPNSVKTIGDNAFDGCANLTEVTIPESVTEIGSYAFYSCKGITEIKIPESVETIGYYAFCYSGITGITIPEGVISIGASAFGYCSSLTEINVDEDNTRYYSDGGVLFDTYLKTLMQYPAGNTATSYTVPSGVEAIGSYAFVSCISLTDVIIPDSVTSIGMSAFVSCISLKSITIGGGAESIGEEIFDECEALKEVICYADKAIVGDSLDASFGGTVTYVPYVVSAEFHTVSGSQLSLPENEVYDVAEDKNVSLSIKADAKVVTIPVKITNKQEIASYTLKITNNNLVIATATGTYKEAIKNIGMIQVVLKGSDDPVGAWLYMYDAEGNKIGSAGIGEPALELPFVPAL